jgi:hypothetical protein
VFSSTFCGPGPTVHRRKAVKAFGAKKALHDFFCGNKILGLFLISLSQKPPEQKCQNVQLFIAEHGNIFLRTFFKVSFLCICMPKKLPLSSSWQPSTCGRRSDGGWSYKSHKQCLLTQARKKTTTNIGS